MTDNVIKFPCNNSTQEEMYNQLEEILFRLKERKIRGFFLLAMVDMEKELKEPNAWVSSCSWLEEQDKWRILGGLEAVKFNLIKKENDNRIEI